METAHLIVFTRYPEPGTAKTRLIPALGAVKAATLSRQMTEHTLNQVKWLQSECSISISIYYTGGTEELMQQWLGKQWELTMQGEGDLGDRMVRSCEAAFAAGCQRVVIIGTDCPDLSPIILKQAFWQLEHQDVVLGPAADGGYYLIGLRRLVPQLFKGIAWSTATVFQETLTIAQQLNLTIALLPVLQDIDYPDDLTVWQRIYPSD